jgi:glutaredoxin
MMRRDSNQHLLLRKALAAGALLIAAASAQAQAVYRIVGPDGKITFSDKPPAAGTAKLSPASRDGKSADAGLQALPFELRQVVQRFPVTLYSAANCVPCGNGRNLLASRGIPFSERTVSSVEDNEALLRLSGESALPLLTIGGQQIKGFSDSEWNQFLTVAGYPASSALPASYRNPPVAPLVALQKPQESRLAPAATPTTAEQTTAPVPGNAVANPAGIRF